MKTLATVLMALTASTAHAGRGGMVGNGGDTVVCQASKDNNLSGTYILDYVAGSQEGLFTLDETLDAKQIRDLLESRLPDAAEDLSHFMVAAKRQIFAKPDFDSIYTWVSQRQGVISVDDEFLTKNVPQNCRDLSGKVMATQAVVREERQETTIYYYDFNQLSALQRQSALQMSMLMIHEWLWYYSSNADIVRQLNTYFHSKEFRQANKTQTINVLNKLGFNMTRQPRRPEPPQIEVEINSCDLSQLKPVTLKGEKNIGVNPVFINHTDCGFSVYSDSFGRPYQKNYSRTVDTRGDHDDYHVLENTLPGFNEYISLAYFFDANNKPQNPPLNWVPIFNVIEDDTF